MSKITTPAMLELKKKNIKKSNSAFQDGWFRFRRNKIALLGLIITTMLLILALFPDFIAPYGQDQQEYENAFIFPNLKHPMGTDNYGRDILSRIIYGARTSLFVGLGSVSIALLLGGSLGIIAAYYGGKIDNLIMRVMDIFYALPSLILAIAISSALGSGMFILIFSIGVSFMPGFARIVRAAGITIRSQEYMEAAKSIGCSTSRMVLFHMFPNAIAPIIVQTTLGVARAILAGASLSFIGVGVQPPTAEWGFMLNAGRQYIRTNWYIVTFPGIMIMITIFGLNLLGDGLRDALDPKLKR